MRVCSFWAGEQFLPQAKSSGWTGEEKKSTKVTMLITINMMMPMNSLRTMYAVTGNYHLWGRLAPRR